MFPTYSKESVSSTVLPEVPSDGEVYSLPEGQTAGGGVVINMYKNLDMVGSATGIVPVPNVSGMVYLERASTKSALKKNDVLRVEATQFAYTELTFYDFFGWMGTATEGFTSVSYNKYVKVRQAIPVGPQDSGYHLYEKVCLELIGDTNEPKTNS